jgi:NADH:ubiquinone oxidoreductase subunit 5 (subunit L)/multisubunit Na+/H+ antiporter MnhA subunit
MFSIAEGACMSRYTNLLGLAAVYMGILGLILAAGSPTINRELGASLGAGIIAWIVGLVFLVGAFLDARRPT